MPGFCLAAGSWLGLIPPWEGKEHASKEDLEMRCPQHPSLPLQPLLPTGLQELLPILLLPLLHVPACTFPFAHWCLWAPTPHFLLQSQPCSMGAAQLAHLGLGGLMETFSWCLQVCVAACTSCPR